MIFRSKGDRKGGHHRRLEKRLGHRFRDQGLLDAALTHRSFANERELEENYERLEFLGDAVLDLVSAEWLYRSRPLADEGELSQLKSSIVSEPSLARIAEELGLGPLLRLGVGEERSGGRSKPSLLADALEALVGALYVDGGLESARPFVESVVESALADGESVGAQDAKSALQERLQGDGRPLPRYVVVSSDGPDHEKLFTVECQASGRIVGVGSGRSKKLAEQSAAEAALRELETQRE